MASVDELQYIEQEGPHRPSASLEDLFRFATKPQSSEQLEVLQQHGIIKRVCPTPSISLDDLKLHMLSFVTEALPWLMKGVARQAIAERTRLGLSWRERERKA